MSDSITVDTSRDLPDLVHGIVSLDPPTVRCDGCGYEHVDTSINLAVLCSGIVFNAIAYSQGDQRRLCAECRKTAGWVER